MDNLTTHRFVAILNKKVEPGRLMNALGHMAVGFTALYPETAALRFDNYVDKDGGVHPSISDNPKVYPIVKTSNRRFLEPIFN